jgi:colanic acid/amylovoran biosynthesis glycosyltransferase
VAERLAGDHLETVLIFRRTLLPVSETFIEAQAGALRSFHPRYVGLLRAAQTLYVAPDSILLAGTRSIASLSKVALYSWTNYAPQFHRAARLARPSLIHAHFAIDGATALPLAAALKIPLIVTLHGYDVTMSDRFIGKTLAGKLYLQRRQRLWQYASQFLCVSEFIRRKAIEAGFPQEKLRVHFIGIDREKFKPEQGFPGKIVLFVGRLVEKKGCIHLLRAMRKVQDVEPAATAVILGDGPLRPTLESSARNLNLRFEFLGSQPSSIVRQWIAKANMLCIPSVTVSDGGSEGLGMVILEAQAVGRPVVGFRTGGIPEAIQENATGLLAPPGDEVALAEQILRYLQDEDLWRSASARGIRWIAERFDLKRQTEELEAIYEECRLQTQHRTRDREAPLARG